MGTLILIAAVLFAGYLISLRLHPYRACSSCKGSGRHFGSMFTYSHRQCTSCGGNGRRGRAGLNVIHRGGPNWGERTPGQAAAKRGKNFGR